MFYSHFCYEIYKWFKVWTELKHIKGVALSLILKPPLPPPLKQLASLIEVALFKLLRQFDLGSRN